jgi:hypothetical protein
VPGALVDGADDDGAGEVEEDSGIGPFLEPRETRRENGKAAEELPDAERNEPGIRAS